MTRIVAVLMTLVSMPFIAAGQSNKPTKIASPDQTFVATITNTGTYSQESRLSVARADGTPACSHDFSSSDGEHGYGADAARWSRDGEFFVVQMSTSGGHSPSFNPIIIWNRKTNRLYSLKNYTADGMLSLSAPDVLAANTWPEMKPASVPLHTLKESELRPLYCFTER